MNTAHLAAGRLADQLDADRELLMRFRQIENAGFRLIYPNRQELFNELITCIIPSAKQELKVMGICISLFRESDKPVRRITWDSAKTADGLVTIIEKGCTVKALFLKRYPSADDRKYYGLGPRADLYFMRERDEEFDYDFRRGRRLKIIANRSVGHFIRVMIELARRSQNEGAAERTEIMNRLQICEYIAFPSLSLYDVDEDIYVTPYLNRRHCSSVPAFKASGKLTDLYAAYNGHFEATWKSAQASRVIDERFVELLAAKPKAIVELFESKVMEISDREEARVKKSPIYNEDPERYRIEEKAAQEILHGPDAMLSHTA